MHTHTHTHNIHTHTHTCTHTHTQSQWVLEASHLRENGGKQLDQRDWDCTDVWLTRQCLLTWHTQTPCVVGVCVLALYKLAAGQVDGLFWLCIDRMLDMFTFYVGLLLTGCWSIWCYVLMLYWQGVLTAMSVLYIDSTETVWLEGCLCSGSEILCICCKCILSNVAIQIQTIPSICLDYWISSNKYKNWTNI